MAEIWKDIIGYQGFYQVSNKGRIRSFKNTKQVKIMKQKVSKGYFLIGLTKDKKQKTYSVHRIVATAFIPNINGKPEVNHINENKLDNSANNLEWVTSKENSNWGSRNQKIKEYMDDHPEKYINFCGTRKRIIQIDKTTGEYIREFNSISEIVKEFGYHQGNISSCCLGKKKSASGFRWQYAN